MSRRTETAVVDVEAIARAHGISPGRWPDGHQLHAAFVDAERKGAGSRLRAWLRGQKIANSEDLGHSLGRARGKLALEQDRWPPPPIRGATYGKDDFGGLIASLEWHPVVAELLAQASSWPDQMQRLTEGRYRYWYDDGRIASLARGIVHEYRNNAAVRVRTGESATPALARRFRDAMVAHAKRQLRELRHALDPKLYDPSSSPQEVFPTLCSISTDAARRVLEDIHGVEFEGGREGRSDGAALCDGRTTLGALATKAQAEAARKKARDAEQRKRRAKEAQGLLAVRDDAATRGPVTRTRFNLAYWRAHPEISKYQRSYRGLSVKRPNGWAEATVRGPRGFGYHAKVRGTEEDAIAALFETLRSEATMHDPKDPDESTAQLEYIDVVTGEATEATEPGTRSTGRVVAQIDGETVPIDEEDLIGRGDGPNPRTRRYRFDADSPADYPGQAQAKKAARSAKTRAKKARAKKTRKARIGLRQTFDSAATAAAMFYEHNEDFLDHVHDPWDGLRDWMDGIEVRVGRGGHRKLDKTAAGRKILETKHAAVAIRKALAYLLGRAKGRRWDAVPWDQVDRLGEALERYYEAPTRGPGRRGLYWQPFAGSVRVEDLDAMAPEQREAVRVQESVRRARGRQGHRTGRCAAEGPRGTTPRGHRAAARPRCLGTSPPDGASSGSRGPVRPSTLTRSAAAANPRAPAGPGRAPAGPRSHRASQGGRHQAPSGRRQGPVRAARPPDQADLSHASQRRRRDVGRR